MRNQFKPIDNKAKKFFWLTLDLNNKEKTKVLTLSLQLIKVVYLCTPPKELRLDLKGQIQELKMKISASTITIQIRAKSDQ